MRGGKGKENQILHGECCHYVHPKCTNKINFRIKRIYLLGTPAVSLQGIRARATKKVQEMDSSAEGSGRPESVGNTDQEAART